MSTLSTLRRAGTAIGGAAALTLIIATPAFASSQWPNCYHGQVGSTYWKANGDYDSIAPVYGIWANRNGDLVRSATQYYAIDAPRKFRLYGEGTDRWALRGIYVGYDDIEHRGVKCQGGEASAVVDLAYNTVPLRTDSTVPPPPDILYVPLVDDVILEGGSG